MINQPVCVTHHDLERLKRLLDNPDLMRQRPHLEKLAARLAEAQSVVDSSEVPRNVITMNSTARLIDQETNEEMVLTVVYPEDSDIDSGRISVLAPVGMAILGGYEGEVVRWDVPAGQRVLRIDRVLYQPEAEGRED